MAVSVALLSSTLDKFVESKFLDNISARNAFLGWLKSKGRIRKWDGTGTYITETALSKIDKTKVQAVEGYDELDLKPEEGQVKFQFTPKRIFNSILISHDEREANQGKEQAIDLLESKAEQAELEIGEKFNEWLLSDGTSEGGKVVLGLKAIIPVVANAGTIAGIDRSLAANAWARSLSDTGAKTTNNFDNLRSKMNNMTNKLTRGGVFPELYLTTQTVYEGYEALFYDKVMITDNETVNLGFAGGVKFKRGVVVFEDDAVIDAGMMYFINSKALRLRCVHNGGSIFKTSKMVDLYEEGGLKMLAYAKGITWRGALTFNMPRTLGCLHSIT
jgi:hypothetical protein